MKIKKPKKKRKERKYKSKFLRSFIHYHAQAKQASNTP